MPPKTRQFLEAEIAALQAELATIQPRILTVENVIRSGSVEFKLDGSRHVDVTARRRGDDTRVLNIIRSDAAGELRDWLNYHFPKTEENS